MDINQYDIFEKDTIALAKSIVIKSSEIAETINQGLIENGYFNIGDDPRTWKYYMNLNGLYHPSDPKPFIIVSKDTLKPIEFTKENLAEHPATALGYKKGSDDYNLMISRYPEHEMLIQGIVDPVDMDKIIESKDFSILTWDRDLIENNEYTLIDSIQKYTDSFFLNYHNKAYNLVDNLYLCSCIGVYYIHLPNIILNIRLNNCHTSEAHSFHIWAYLSSYGNLDRWKNVLDEYQIHYLYRNIRSINDNAGQTIVFNDLVRVLLSRNLFPLYGYDLRHIISQIQYYLNPEAVAVRYRIDESVNVTNFTETKNISTLIDDTIECAKDNIKVRDETIEKCENKLIKSDKDWLVTKVLESELVNELENIPLQVRYIAYNHWVYLSGNNTYIAGISLEYNPASISVQLSSKDALILHYYCNCKIFDFTPEYIPELTCFNVKKVNPPSKEDLLYINGDSLMEDKWINELIERQTVIESIESVNEFNELCYRIRENDFEDKCEVSRFQTLNKNAIAHLMTNAFWSNYRVHISDESYKDFFARISIDPSLITQENAKEISNTIYHLITGLDPNDLGKSKLLESLIALLSYLSSYSIQIIESDKYSNMMNIEWKYEKLEIEGIYASTLPVYIILMINTFLSEKAFAYNTELFSIAPVVIKSSEFFVHHYTFIRLILKIYEIVDENTVSISVKDTITIPRVGVLNV